MKNYFKAVCVASALSAASLSVADAPEIPVTPEQDETISQFSQYFNGAVGLGLVKHGDDPMIVVQKDAYQCAWPVQDAGDATIDCADLSTGEYMQMDIAAEEKGELTQQALLSMAGDVQKLSIDKSILIEMMRQCIAPPVLEKHAPNELVI